MRVTPCLRGRGAPTFDGVAAQGPSRPDGDVDKPVPQTLESVDEVIERIAARITEDLVPQVKDAITAAAQASPAAAYPSPASVDEYAEAPAAIYAALAPAEAPAVSCAGPAPVHEHAEAPAATYAVPAPMDQCAEAPAVTCAVPAPVQAAPAPMSIEETAEFPEIQADQSSRTAPPMSVMTPVVEALHSVEHVIPAPDSGAFNVCVDTQCRSASCGGVCPTCCRICASDVRDDSLGRVASCGGVRQTCSRFSASEVRDGTCGRSGSCRRRTCSCGRKCHLGASSHPRGTYFRGRVRGLSIAFLGRARSSSLEAGPMRREVGNAILSARGCLASLR